MTTITTRAAAGAPLSNATVDANFTNLNTAKLELGQAQSSGTANGVLYLNGSKQVASGSALTFDGTNMAIGTSPQTYATLILNGDKTALRVERGSAIGFAYNTGTAATDPFRIQSNAGPVDLYTASGQPITFSAGAAEQMRLTSTGLGIGTSSPVSSLTIGSLGVTETGSTSYGAALIRGSDYTLSNTRRGILDIEMNAVGGQNNGATLTFTNNIGIFGQGQDYVGAGIKAAKENGTNTNQSTYLALYTNSSGTLAERARIDSSGNLGLGTSSPAKKLDVAGTYRAQIDPSNSSLFGSTLTLAGDNGTNQSGARVAASYEGGFGLSFQISTAGQAGLSSDPSLLTYTTRMRLDSSGNLGLGTSSPGHRLDVTGAAGSFAGIRVNASSFQNAGLIANRVNNGNTAALYFTESGANQAYIMSYGSAYGSGLNSALQIVNGSNALTYDASGNLGLGVTPSAWNSQYKVLQVGASSALWGTNGYTFLSENVYSNSSDVPTYINTGTNATMYRMDTGAHKWYTAPSGTAGNAISFTQAMTLDASGKLMVGDTSNRGEKLRVYDGSSTSIGIIASTTGVSYLNFGDTADANVGFIGYDHTNNFMNFRTNGTEHARIDSSGNLLLGTTSAVSGSKLVVGGGDATVYGLTVGRGAGAVATNTAVGASALAANTTAVENAAFGYYALKDNTGLTNTAVGAYAAYLTTTGNGVSAFGNSALQSNTSGTDITGVGKLALQANTTGSYNTAVGRSALHSNTTASYNTAVGYQAGYSGTTGQFNLLLGEAAGYSNAIGNYNTFVGRRAGYYSTGGGNTFIGNQVGENVTTGIGNVFVGSNGPNWVPAGYYVTTGSKNTILGNYNGNQGGLDIRTASNHIVLSDGDGNPRLIGNGSGNFAMGSAPSSLWAGVTALQLNTAGSVSSTGLYTALQNGLVATSGGYAWKYLTSTTGLSMLLNNVTGNFEWYNAVAGTAGSVASPTLTMSVGESKTLALQGASTQAGTGITFPATQNASSNANTLDDYEEGTWTPTLVATGTAFSGASFSGIARYVKIGRVVNFFIGGTFTFNVAGTGDFAIGGLPFTIVSTGSTPNGGAAPLCRYVTWTGSYMTDHCRSNTTNIEFWGVASGGNYTRVPCSGLTSGFEIYMSHFYEAEN